MNSFTRAYIHFVWATWDRDRLITSEFEAGLYSGIAGACRDLKGQPLEIGGTEDHVHVLVRLPATVSIADMAQKMKGSSSHLVNHALQPGLSFRWQGTYGAVSVSPQDVARVRAYIRNQKRHHADNELLIELEQANEES